MTVDVPLDPAFAGGRSEESYQRILRRIARRRTGLQRVDADPVSRIQAGHAKRITPYIFIANARVVRSGIGSKRVQPKKLERDRRMWAASGFTPACRFSDHHRTVRSNCNPAMTGSSCSGPNRVRGDPSERLRPHHRPEIECGADRHDVHRRGRAPTRISIRSDDTPIRLPAHCLRGEIVEITIRDLSGQAQIFLSLPVLAHTHPHTA